MITFVQDGKSLFGEEFFVGGIDQEVPRDLLSEVFVVSSDFSLKEFHYKDGFGIEDMSQWRVTHDGVGVGTFENASGKKFALRLDLIQNAPAKFGRAKFGDFFGYNKPHIFIPYAEESRRRGIGIENAVGFFRIFPKSTPHSDLSVSLVIIEVLSNCDKIGEVTESVAFQMGKILSDTHNAGVIHAHPHLLNWVLVNRMPRLVDAKGLLIDSDFPWYTCLNRVHNFSDMRASDCAHVINGLQGSTENVDAFHEGYRLS